jgi:hypothetical protein
MNKSFKPKDIEFSVHPFVENGSFSINILSNDVIDPNDGDNV